MATRQPTFPPRSPSPISGDRERDRLAPGQLLKGITDGSKLVEER